MSTSLRDTLVRERYLAQFSWALQDFPKYKRVVRDLRTELNATGAEVGMRQAVADLGRPRALAESYLRELGRPVPRWTTGAVWGTLAVAVVVYLALAYAVGTLDTLEQLGGGSVERVFLGATTTLTSDDNTFGLETSFTWQVLAFYAVVFAVPFLLGARVWRARTPTRSTVAVSA